MKNVKAQKQLSILSSLILRVRGLYEVPEKKIMAWPYPQIKDESWGHTGTDCHFIKGQK